MDSDLIWDYLEKNKITNRGEATQVFADLLLQLIGENGMRADCRMV